MEHLDRLERDGPDNSSKVLRLLCRDLVRKTGYRQCWINLKNGKQKRGSVPVAQSGLPKGKRARIDPAFQQLLGKNKLIVARDVMSARKHSDLRAVAADWNFKSMAFFPLMDRKRVLGTLCLHASEPTDFEHMELDPLRALSKRLSLYLSGRINKSTNGIESL